MKRCPVCNNVYDNGMKFCEDDGSLLVADSPRPHDAASSPIAPAARRAAQAERPRPFWIDGVIGAVVGITICILGLAIYHYWGRRAEQTSSSQPTAALDSNAGARPTQSRVIAPEAIPTPSPTASPEPSTTPAPTPPQTTANTGTGLETLSDTPVSTGSAKSGADSLRTTIHLADGTSFEVDDVWKSAGGVWYRRGTVVSLIDPASIKAIERHAPAPTPAASPPAP
jgi:hypothetical protein